MTDSFLGMQKKLIKCQNVETVETCNTRSYLKRIQESCSCIPFSLKYHTGPVKVICTVLVEKSFYSFIQFFLVTNLYSEPVGLCKKHST